MSVLSTSTRHGAVTQSLHWLTVVAVGAAYVFSVGGPEARVYSDAGAASLQLHETLGMLVFALVGVRLLWRLVDRAPKEPPHAHLDGMGVEGNSLGALRDGRCHTADRDNRSLVRGTSRDIARSWHDRPLARRIAQSWPHNYRPPQDPR